jgi:hypothetical protein
MFTLPDVWSGGDFELSIQLGPHDNVKLGRALTALWSHPTLVGCYLENTKDPTQQRRVSPETQPLVSQLFGTATAPNGCTVVCASLPMRYETGTDYLYFSVPLGSMGRAYEMGGYPFSDCLDSEWPTVVSEWYRDIGEAVYDAAGFQLAVIGHEVDPGVSLAQIERNGVPDERWDGYLYPEDQLLCWYPPNRPLGPATDER